jgi:uncharacterized protein
MTKEKRETEQRERSLRTDESRGPGSIGAGRHHMRRMTPAPSLARLSQPSVDAAAAKLLCDEMLQRLGRWLRAAGYDTVIAEGGKRDRDLLARAIRERRVLVTRDRKLAEHRGADGLVVVLRANDLEGCVGELTGRLAIDWLLNSFTRCILCNAELAPLPPALMPGVPRSLAGSGAGLRHCPLCWKIFWKGGHVERMRRRLESWQRPGRAAAHLLI